MQLNIENYAGALKVIAGQPGIKEGHQPVRSGADWYAEPKWS